MGAGIGGTLGIAPIFGEAGTVADVAGDESIGEMHLAAAIG
jgi:hypothetical protein